MDNIRDEFYEQLYAVFKIEAGEHLTKMSSGLLELESSPKDKFQEIVEDVFREAHSLKGATRTVNLTDLESVCQKLENIFSALKRKELQPFAELYDLLHQTINIVGEYLSTSDPELISLVKFKIKGLSIDLTDIIKQNIQAEQKSKEKIKKNKPADIEKTPNKGPEDKFIPGDISEEGPEKIKPGYVTDVKITAPEKHNVSDTIRIATGKLDDLLLQTEELLNAKIISLQHISDIRELGEKIEVWKSEWKKIGGAVKTVKKKSSGKQFLSEEKWISDYNKTMNFLEWNSIHLAGLEAKINTLIKIFKQDNWQINGMVDTLIKDMKHILMFPFASLVGMFPKVVRDLSYDLGKQAVIEIKGGEIEIDRRILEEIKDPLIHIIRNCIDHGIEKPAVREKLKKNIPGKIELLITQVESSKVEIIIRDDGAGISTDDVTKAAVKKGIITEENATKLSKHDAIMLIFKSDLSTSSTITDISGRGLGLAIVREKVEKLGGSISVETIPGYGTTFKLLLPLTIATFRGILIGLGGKLFVIPTLSVERVIRIKKEDVKTVENREAVLYQEKPISLVRLSSILEINATSGKESNFLILLIIGNSDKRIAFVVDEVISDQEILVKSLNEQVERMRNVSGATVLGSGKIVPILNVQDLVKSAERVSGPTAQIDMIPQSTKPDEKSILVVDDSITSRMLVKDILESAGYKIKTAVDGIEALTAIKSESFDLIISDIEMPRMNGFTLTEKIRKDEKLSHLPVILVTGLASREDREKGIESGANAYIVKSNFNQTNLLEIIKRLI